MKITRLVFAGTRRFEKWRPRPFVVTVWRRCREEVGKRPAAPIWGKELAEAWRAVNAAR